MQDKNDNNLNLSDNIVKKSKSPILKERLIGVLKYLVVAIVIGAIFFAGYFTHYFSLNKDLRSIQFLLDTYNKHYYKPTEQNITKLIGDSIMDAYSEYYTAEEYQQVIASGNGSRTGYGFSFSNLTLTKVLLNSPMYNAGIRAGSKLIGYKKTGDAEFITASTDVALNEFLNGLGEYESVDFLIDNGEEQISYTVVKSEYIETYVRYVDQTGCYVFSGQSQNDIQFTKVNDLNLNLQSGWAYLQLTSFNGRLSGVAGGAGQFERALQQFKDNGNKKLIIDLRSNGGGYMSILCEIASHLCYNGEADGQSLICQKAIYNDGHEELFKTSKTDYLKYGYEKIVFLANSGSASASEALMGTVLDYDKKCGYNIVNVVLEGTQVNGETVYRSYGKGIMQSTFTNGITGEAVKLTTAQIYWPVYDTTIHGIGLTPELDSRILATIGNPIDFAQTL